MAVWERHEPFGNEHTDWLVRASAPYIIFDARSSLTDFNLENPLRVATKAPTSVFEEWCSNRGALVKRLEESLFGRFNNRRLRTTNKQQPHRHIAIHSSLLEHEGVSCLLKLITELLEISRLARERQSARG